MGAMRNLKLLTGGDNLREHSTQYSAETLVNWGAPPPRLPALGNYQDEACKGTDMEDSMS